MRNMRRNPLRSHNTHNSSTRRYRNERLEHGEVYLYGFAADLDRDLEKCADLFGFTVGNGDTCRIGLETVVCDNGEIQIDYNASQMYDIVLYKKETPGYVVKCFRSYDGSSNMILELPNFRFASTDAKAIAKAIISDLIEETDSRTVTKGYRG